MRQPWTLAQRGVLLMGIAVLLAYLTVRYAINSSYVADPQPPQPARYFDLADRINPNVVDWQTLAALPGIGERRGRDIVGYREQFLLENPDRRAFESADDLLRIRGFGHATVANLRPYFIFGPDAAPDATARDVGGATTRGE